MKFKNIFTKGCITDLDYSMRPPQYWDFPTLNIRIINKGGKGFVITNADGTEEAFSLPTSFVVVGATEYNGIIYIVSHNSVTNNGEIGCYPSPTEWNADNTEFERVYKPLHNYTLYPLRELRTPRFNFQNTIVDIIAKESYDGSVDLYITDFYNPIRVINTNFNQNGNLLERFISSDSFDGAINLIASSKIVMNPTLTAVEDGGVLEPGMYYLFFRYLTENFNGTTFLEELGPIQVSDGNTAVTTTGMQYKDWIDDRKNYSNKQISLKIDNLDSAYKYIQIGVVYYSATVENAEATRNVYYIDKNFIINSSSMNIVVTGRESRGVLTFEQIITPRMPYNINKTHTSINNVYYGGGWKKQQKAHTDEHLVEFAKRIVPEYALSGDKIAKSGYDGMWAHEKAYANRAFYKDEDNVLRYTGYLHGEVYPFAIEYLFDDGVVSEAYAIRGNVNGVVNYKGLYQFPFWDSVGTSVGYALGIKFNLDTANTYKLANNDNFANIIGFRFVRGDRIDNFICQGVVLPCFDKLKTTNGDAGFGLGSNTSPTQNLNMPLFRGMLPTCYYDGNDSYSYYAAIGHLYYSSNPTHETGINELKAGLFSSDVILGDLKAVPSNCFMKFAFVMSGNIYQFSDDYISPKVMGLENLTHQISPIRPNDTCRSPVDQDTEYDVQASIIDKHTNEGALRFTSYLPGYQAYKQTNLIQEYNRSYRTLKYVGLNFNKKFHCCTYGDIASGFPLVDYLEVFNLYKTEPTDTYFINLVNNYTISSKVYQSISEVLPMNRSGHKICFKGDCFLQKSFYRTHRWYKYDYACPNSAPGVTGEGSQYFANANNVWYQSGFMLGMVTENLINADMRNEVRAYDDESNKIIYSFFPKCLPTYVDAKEWVILRDIDAALEEAAQVNDGFNRILSGKEVIGYDESIPSDSLNERLNRIYNSGKHIPGSFIDGFRFIGLSNYIDLASEDGLLQRLVSFNDQLISIQENAINQHPIKERVTDEDQTSGSIVIASSVSMLPDFFSKQAEFGTQHMHSIMVTKNGIYGVDWNNNVIWKVAAERAQTGNKFIKVINLLDENFFHKEWEEIKAYHTSYNDIISVLDDDPLNKMGIVAGYNKMFDEVYFTFMFGRARGSAEPLTIGYHDKLNFFLGNYSWTPYMYISTRNKIFSVHNTDKKVIHRHDDASHPLRVYGTNRQMKLSFIVNGIDEKQNLVDIEKIFESLHIEMNDKALHQIIYETESAYGTYNFLTKDNDSGNSFWLHSEYLENEWQVPVVVQTSSKDKDYNTDSDMRGHWMKVTLITSDFLPKGVAQDSFYIKKVITDYKQSNS